MFHFPEFDCFISTACGSKHAIRTKSNSTDSCIMASLNNGFNSRLLGAGICKIRRHSGDSQKNFKRSHNIMD